MTDILHQIDDKADALFRFAAILAAALATALKLLEAPSGVVKAALPSLVVTQRELQACRASLQINRTTRSI